MTDRLIQAALAAADLFRQGDTPVQSEIRELVRAADDFRNRRHSGQDHEAECLMCAVRALTEGDPDVIWTPIGPGATISGVVLRQGEVSTNLGKIPYVDLWQGGTGRIRVMAHSATLRHALAGAAAQIGDRLRVWFDGVREVETRGTGRMTEIKRFTVEVQRGH